MSEYEGPERRTETITVQRGIVKLVLGVLIFSVVIGITLSAVAVSVALSVQDSNDRIETAQNQVAVASRRVARNTIAIRLAGYETCERGNGVRAELQFRASLTPPQLAKRLIHQLGLPAKLAQSTSAAAVRARLPIYDCDPLLHNEPAEILSNKEQDKFVRAFAEGNKDLPSP